MCCCHSNKQKPPTWPQKRGWVSSSLPLHTWCLQGGPSSPTVETGHCPVDMDRTVVKWFPHILCHASTHRRYVMKERYVENRWLKYWEHAGWGSGVFPFILLGTLCDVTTLLQGLGFRSHYGVCALLQGLGALFTLVWPHCSRGWVLCSRYGMSTPL